MTPEVPTPGSREAQEKGCTCAVMDNRYGAGITYGTNREVCFYITQDCPMHGYPDTATD